MAAKESYFPLAGGAQDGWSNEKEATATCFCGAVQLAFPVQGPGLINAFVCHCADCHKITASQFATNFTADEGHVRHLRGRDNLRVYSQSATVATGNSMANHFCATCGTLMYRVSSGAPRSLILRVGTVDDFALQDELLGPRAEQFTKDRRAWVPDMRAPPVAARHEEGNPTPDYFSKSTM